MPTITTSPTAPSNTVTMKTSAPTVAAAVEATRQPDKIEGQVTEAAQIATEPTKEATQDLSPKFAALARKEKALRQQAEAVKAERARMEAERAEYQNRYVSKERLTQDSLGVLSELGITRDHIADLMLNGDSPQNSDLLSVRKELEELKTKYAQYETKAQEKETEAYKQAVSQIRHDVTGLVSVDPNFETIKDTKSEDAVVELIEREFEASGKILSIEEACLEVENYLVEEGLKMANLRKVKAKFAAPTEAVDAAAATALEAPEAKPKLQSQQVSVKTLTNAQMASTSKPLTRAERRQRAILAGMGQLK